MPDGAIKKVAIIGANKEGLRLLPFILKDRTSSIAFIADPNRDAMLFKLNELGYKLSAKFNIKVTNDLNELKSARPDIIVNALQDPATEKFLESPEFKNVEKLGPLGAKLIWTVRSSTISNRMDPESEQTGLLSSLREIVDAVRLTIDRKELLSVILKLATESTKAERGSIMLVSQEEGTLRVEMAKGMDEEVVRKIRVRLGEGISGKVAKEGKPMLVSGRADNEKFAKAIERNDAKSSMSVPLIVSGETIGVVNVSTSESTHTFTNEDLEFLCNLADLAAEVIHRSNEYERMRVNAAKFSFWKEVDSVMSSALPIEKRLTKVVKRLSEMVQGLTCFIYAYDEERGRLILKGSSIRDAKAIGLLSLRPGEGIEGSGISDQADTILVDRAQEGNIKRVYLSLPMVCNNTLVGVLNGHVVSAGGLSKYHESFIKEIRTLIAESIYKDAQAEREKMRTRKIFAVDEAGLEMITIADRKRLYPILATTPAAILGAEGSLLRIRGAGSKFQTAAAFGLDDISVREYFLPIEKETVMEVLRKKETVYREFSEEVSPYIRSVLARPFFVNNEITGVMTFFNKTSEGALFPCGFSKTDAEILSRFAVYAEKALAFSMKAAEAKPVSVPGRAVENMPSTGHQAQTLVRMAADNNVPFEQAQPVQPRVQPQPAQLSPLAAFEKRVDEELNRARRHEKNLVVSTIRLAGLKGLQLQHKTELESKILESIKSKTRNFDFVTRFNEETFGFLFVDTNEKIMMRLLSSITEVVASDDSANRALADGRIDILYGYGIFPKDGDSFAELFSKASNRVRLDFKKAYGPEF